MGINVDEDQTYSYKHSDPDRSIICYIELCQSDKSKKYKGKWYFDDPEDYAYKTQSYNPEWGPGWNYSDRISNEINEREDYYGWQNRTYGSSWKTGRGIHVCFKNHYMHQNLRENVRFLQVICYLRDFVAASKHYTEYRGGEATFAKVFVEEEDWNLFVSGIPREKKPPYIEPIYPLYNFTTQGMEGLEI